MMLSNMIGNGSSNVSKKPFSFDLDYLLVAVLFLVVLFGSKAMAFEVSAPTSVEVLDKEVFYVELNNDSSKIVDLKVNFYSPADAVVSVPKQLAPNSKTSAKITVTNTFKDKRMIVGLVEAHFGTQILTKDVNLSFSPKQNNSTDSALIGLFSFGATLTEFELFTPVDWVIFIILVVVCAVLLISFISRVKRGA